MMDKKVNKDSIQNLRKKFSAESRERQERKPPGTISLEQARELIGDPKLTDGEVEEIKEQVRQLVEVIYEKWLQDREKKERGLAD